MSNLNVPVVDHAAVAEAYLTSLRLEFERQLPERVGALLNQTFGTMADLVGGPVFQLHAKATENGLGKPVPATKTAKLVNMKVGDTIFIPSEKRVTVSKLESRWSGIRQHAQKRSNFKWRINRDHDRGGVRITRTK